MPLSSGFSYDMENHQFVCWLCRRADQGCWGDWMSESSRRLSECNCDFGTHFPLLGVYCMSAHALCCVAALLFGSLMQLRLSG